MYDQGPASQHAYCPAHFEFVKQKPKTAASKLSPEGSAANTVNSTSTTRQNGSHAADSQTKPIRLPDAPLAICSMPFACPAKALSEAQTAKASRQLTATFLEQPALPLRPAPSSGPAWKRVARPASGMTKSSDSSLISRLSKLTRANGSPIPSGHVAGVVPPHSSHQPLLHSPHQFHHHPPHLPHPSATSEQAAEAQHTEHYGSTADDDTAMPQHSPGSSRQGIAQNSQGYPSATVAALAEPAKPDKAAQTKHRPEEHDPSASTEVDGGTERAHSPAPQPSPPSQPNEPQVKPKSTQHSRLRLQRPLRAAVTPSPAATHNTGDTYRPAGIWDSAQKQASRPSHAPGTAELDRSLLVSQPPGYSSKDPSGDPLAQPLGYPPRQTFEHPSGDPAGHPQGAPLSYPSGHSPRHCPLHPLGHPSGLRQPPSPDSAADTPSASGSMPKRPVKGSVDECAHTRVSSLQVPSHNLVLKATILGSAYMVTICLVLVWSKAGLHMDKPACANNETTKLCVLTAHVKQVLEFDPAKSLFAAWTIACLQRDCCSSDPC